MFLNKKKKKKYLIQINCSKWNYNRKENQLIYLSMTISISKKKLFWSRVKGKNTISLEIRYNDNSRWIPMVNLLNRIPSSKLIIKCHAFLLTSVYIVGTLWFFSFFCRQTEYAWDLKIVKIKYKNKNEKYTVHDKINIILFLFYIYIFF